MRDISKNIKAIRQAKEMTQEALADALHVTRQTVSNYENGRSRPDLDMLLKIAEILETDVNTLIYGPPVPQSKKSSYKWLAISAGILIVATVLYTILSFHFPKETAYGYRFSLRLINQFAVLPVVMFVLGWFLMHVISIFSKLQQLCAKKYKALRIITLTVLILFVAIPIPYIIFFAIAGYRSYVYHSVSMSFPYIPLYQEAFRIIEGIVFKSPFVYTLLGSACWLLGLPGIKKKEDT